MEPRAAVGRCDHRGPRVRAPALNHPVDRLVREVGAALVVLGDGPDLSPEAIDRVIAHWRAEPAPVVAATYDGIRLHPVLLDRAIWRQIPDEGARGLDAVLVSCDDLGPPGDVDFADDVPDRLKPWSSRDP